MNRQPTMSEATKSEGNRIAWEICEPHLKIGSKIVFTVIKTIDISEVEILKGIKVKQFICELRTNIKQMKFV
jgi:hypothetical protein